MMSVVCADCYCDAEYSNAVDSYADHLMVCVLTPKSKHSINGQSVKVRGAKTSSPGACTINFLRP